MGRFLLLLIVGIGLLGGVAAGVLYRRTSEPFKGYSSPERFVEIAPGSTAPEIGRRLVEAGVVRDELTFRVELWRSGLARTLKAGEYRFDSPMTAMAVTAKLARGDVYLLRTTFPEGLTVREMAAIFQGAGFGSAQSFIDAARDRTLISALDPEATDLEGYLFPETYSLPRRTPASRLIRLMVDRFEAVFTPELRQEAAARGLTVRQAVTLASLVERETAHPSERPLVAAVYLNRLTRGMALQCDPTVIYALEREGRYSGNLTRADLAFDSPYNTYRYRGLPPGPIAAPGRASLEASVRASEVDYLYFVSRNDGTHAFARTLAEHNSNVRQFQVLYYREQRLRQQ